MRLARLLLALLVTLVLASSANAAPSASTAAPKSLHGFLFRADEPVRHEFARTPSFAWAPVPGATSYQLELATSSTFRENGLALCGPRAEEPGRVDHAHPALDHRRALFVVCASARGVQERRDGWSKPFGFNMRQTEVPRPVASYPGLLRWTPVEGATAYDVWLIDIPKMVICSTSCFSRRTTCFSRS